MKFTAKGSLLATTIIAGVAIASPAMAQDQATVGPEPDPQAQEATQEANPTASASVEDTDTPRDQIIVTGTLLKRVDTETVSPVTTVSAQNLEERGVKTVTQALQTLSTNNAGTVHNSWNAGGSNFAGGAAGISLRGLNVGYTAVVFDGLRGAAYPYGDDGSRSFVDTNTIPTFSVDRIEVLRDGASSLYGTDAIAGVVNIITKKQITGVHADASYGISQDGEGKEKRVSLVAGWGDLSTNGFNAYIGGEYQQNDQVFARDVAFPLSTGDWTRICGTSLGGGFDGYGNPLPAGAETCMANLIANGLNSDGSIAGGTDGIAATTVPFVAPIGLPPGGALVGDRNAVPLGSYQMLNPAAGCGNLSSVTLNAAQAAGLNDPNLTGSTICQEDFTNQAQVEPQQKRYGISGKVTAQVGADTQVYLMGNWYHNNLVGTGPGISTRGSAFRTAAGGAQLDFRGLVLPVYVCPATTVGACDNTNGVLNPNNPFAAQGQGARLLWVAPNPVTAKTVVDTYRVAGGVSGTFASDWQYNLDATWMRVNAATVSGGGYKLDRLLDVVKDGSFNFVDFSANSQAVLDYVFPEQRANSFSKMYQINGTLAHSFFTLPGGDLAVAIGASYRDESLNWRSSNPPNPSNPADRFDRTINGVGAAGSRNVKSVFAELNAPILDQVEINLSGRYDKYSGGQKAFSPKAGIKVRPIEMITLRGTWSKGFRVASLNEAFGLPTTGFVTDTVTAARAGGAAYLAAHGNNSYATGTYAYGLTSTGNPDLDPEKSRNITLGAIFQPIRPFTFTVDYYDIKIRDLISGADTSAVLDAYYGNNGVVNIPGITVVQGAADPAFPSALPRLEEIQFSFENVGTFHTRGLDFSAELRLPVFGARWTSFAEAARILKLRASNQPFDYVGTLSPCGWTSCSGAPKWKGYWQNTLDFGRATVTGVVNYVSGYDLASVDFGGTPGDCLASLGASAGSFLDGVTPSQCRQKSFITADLTGSFEVTRNVTLYANILNLFDRRAPFDAGATYGIGVNAAFHDAGILGRYFRLGAKVDFDWKRPAVAEAVAPMLPPAPPPAPATQTCADGSVILATEACPVPPPPPPPPPPAPERG